MTEELKNKLKYLAEKYEVSSFYDEDPSQFLNWYRNQEEVELASFVAALLAFGSRTQFIPKIRYIFELADKKGGFLLWIKERHFSSDFHNPNGNDSSKFYRFYSWDDIRILFTELSSVLEKHESLGKAVKNSYEKNISAFNCKSPVEKNQALLKSIQDFFPNSAIVSKGAASANKRLHMFLRWMVRQNSAVDKGFWTWFSPSDLIVPLDTHVMQESAKLCLIPAKANCSFKTAVLLTEELKSVWENDPCKGDFALFGLGVDENAD